MKYFFPLLLIFWIISIKAQISEDFNDGEISSNPTWTPGTTSYVSEIGLFDSDRDLIAISKLQSPIQRQTIQQFLVKLDF